MAKPTQRSMIYKERRELKRLRRQERNEPRYLQRRYRSFYLSALCSVLLFVAYKVVSEVTLAIKGPLWIEILPSWIHVVAVGSVIFPNIYFARHDWLLMIMSFVFWAAVLALPMGQPVLLGFAVVLSLYAVRRMGRLQSQIKLVLKNITRILAETKVKTPERSKADLEMHGMIVQRRNVA